MARTARSEMKGTYYHLVVQGTRSIKVFGEDRDKEKYLKTVKKAFDRKEIQFLGFCLFDNHCHLVIGDPKGNMGDAMRCAHAEYACYYRERHENYADKELFRDRYRCEMLSNEWAVAEVVRFMHQEPVRRSLAPSIEKYPWSSYGMYLLRSNPIVDTQLVTDSLHFAGGFRTYMKENINIQPNVLRETPEKYGRTDEEASGIFETYLEGRDMEWFRRQPNDYKKDMVRLVRRKEDLGIIQLCRITGLTRGIVQRLK